MGFPTFFKAWNPIQVDLPHEQHVLYKKKCDQDEAKANADDDTWADVTPSAPLPVIDDQTLDQLKVFDIDISSEKAFIELSKSPEAQDRLRLVIQKFEASGADNLPCIFEKYEKSERSAYKKFIEIKRDGKTEFIHLSNTLVRRPSEKHPGEIYFEVEGHRKEDRLGNGRFGITNRSIKKLLLLPLNEGQPPALLIQNSSKALKRVIFNPKHPSVGSGHDQINVTLKSELRREHRFLSQYSRGKAYCSVINAPNDEETEDYGYLVMSYIEDSIDLEEYLDQNLKGMNFSERVNLYMQVIECVELAHQRGILHRDIKPDNMIINRRTGQVHLCDFGFADPINNPDKRKIKITPGYAAPEVFGNLRTSLAYKMDNYSVGLIGNKIFGMSETIISERHETLRNYSNDAYKKSTPALINNSQKTSGTSNSSNSEITSSDNDSNPDKISYVESATFNSSSKAKSLLRAEAKKPLDCTSMFTGGWATKPIADNILTEDDVLKLNSKITSLTHHRPKKRPELQAVKKHLYEVQHKLLKEDMVKLGETTTEMFNLLDKYSRTGEKGVKLNQVRSKLNHVRANIQSAQRKLARGNNSKLEDLSYDSLHAEINNIIESDDFKSLVTGDHQWRICRLFNALTRPISFIAARTVLRPFKDTAQYLKDTKGLWVPQSALLCRQARDLFTNAVITPPRDQNQEEEQPLKPFGI